jgi:hypothetical protein
LKLFNSTKKKLVAGAVGLVAIAGVSTGAFAYFTSTGSGSGTGTIGTSHTVTVTGISVSGLTPGGAAQPVSYSFTNTTGNGNQNFGVASVTVDSITPVAGHTCNNTADLTANSANLATTDASTAVGTVNDGATFTASGTNRPTITMNDNGANQDGCQGATLNLTVHIAAGS